MSTLDTPIIEAFWLLFTIASLALITLPGQDMILVMSRSIGQGTKAILVALVRLAFERR
jgi:threonine/homoserine/homoserine lactone efflux protein